MSFCGHCALKGRTCCQGRAVFLTTGDMARIGAFAPDAVPFWERRRVVREASDELWSRIFDAEGAVRVLRLTAAGDCAFLGEKGCRLPMDVRPLVCRLYPYEYSESSLTGIHAHLCPWPERENAPLLLALLEMNRDLAEGWRKSLYEEIRDE